MRTNKQQNRIQSHSHVTVQNTTCKTVGKISEILGLRTNFFDAISTGFLFTGLANHYNQLCASIS